MAGRVSNFFSPGDGRLTSNQYMVLRFLDRSCVKRVVVGTVTMYALLGFCAIAFNLEFVCLQPRLIAGNDGLTLQQASEFQSRSLRGFVPEMVVDNGGNQNVRIGRWKPLHKDRRVHSVHHLRVIGRKPLQMVQSEQYHSGHPDQLECLSPAQPLVATISLSVGITSLCISSLLLLEHVLRMYATRTLYYARNWWLVVDFVMVLACCAGDATIVFALHPMFLQIWKQKTGNPIAGAREIQVAITIIRCMRCCLLYRVYRFVRTEWNPASELSRSMEVVQMLHDDMPNIELLSVHVVRNSDRELRNYAHKKLLVEESGGQAEQMLLFLGTQDTPPEKVFTYSDPDIDQLVHEGELGVAVYGAERPSYVDTCDSYIDWENDHTGRTRKIVVFEALVGNSQHRSDDEFAKKLRQPSAGYDSTHCFSWAPTQYNPEKLGLPPRHIESKIYALYGRRAPVLPIAIVSYKNPDAFEEMNALLSENCNGWRDHYNKFVADCPVLSPEQEEALNSLSEAIDSRDGEKLNISEKSCEEKKVPASALKNLKDGKKRESVSAGICLAYVLSEDFKRRARQATGLDDPTFEDMGKHFFTKSGDFAVGSHMVCPRDLKQGCSYVDSLPSKWRKNPTLMLSWVWKYNLSTLRNALKRWAELHDKDPKEEFMFVCFFCNNQYRILVEKVVVGSADLETLFAERVRNIPRMVAVMDGWEDALYLKRIWTIYEQYVAANHNVPVDFVLPRTQAETMVEQFNKGLCGIEHVIETISRVDAANAKATMPADEQRVKDQIRGDGGFERVNEKVKKRIIEWSVQEFKAKLDQMVG